MFSPDNFPIVEYRSRIYTVFCDKKVIISRQIHETFRQSADIKFVMSFFAISISYYFVGKLKETLPIDRAQMRIKVETPVKLINKVKKMLRKLEGDF